MRILPLTLLPPPAVAVPSKPTTALPMAGEEVPLAVRSFFCEAIGSIATKLGEDFKSRLVVYESSSRLPSGIPGNPAKEYDKSRKQACGTFRPGSLKPYDICPEPSEEALDETSRACCRHFAYAVPYSRFGLAVEDRMSTVVVSQRLFLLEEERWKAILAHEIGHVVDFYLYGKRYGLKNHPIPLHNNNNAMASDRLRRKVSEIDEERDPEVRADALGELFVLEPLQQSLCYDSKLAIQILVDDPRLCDDNESLTRHYSHPPLQGSFSYSTTSSTPATTPTSQR